MPYCVPVRHCSSVTSGWRVTALQEWLFFSAVLAFIVLMTRAYLSVDLKQNSQHCGCLQWTGSVIILQPLTLSSYERSCVSWKRVSFHSHERCQTYKTNKNVLFCKCCQASRWSACRVLVICLNWHQTRLKFIQKKGRFDQTVYVFSQFGSSLFNISCSQMQSRLLCQHGPSSPGALRREEFDVGGKNVCVVNRGSFVKYCAELHRRPALKSYLQLWRNARIGMSALPDAPRVRKRELLSCSHTSQKQSLSFHVVKLL